MRARKKKNTIPRLERVSEYFVEQITPLPDKKVYLEIGCGKGKFITTLATLHPENEYYAMEKVPDVMVMAAEKCAEKEIKNLHFLLDDAENLGEICPDEALDGIFLNFSDPWPKKKHTHRRLTDRHFLKKYEKAMKLGGELKIKTDSEVLFDYSLAEIDFCEVWGVKKLTLDLHNDEEAENEATTEYEDRFVEEGKNINFMHWILEEKAGKKPLNWEAVSDEPWQGEE